MWLNPSGGKVRYDSGGFGNFGASRDSGARSHSGLDITANPGQGICLPTDAQYRRKMRVYQSTAHYTGMEFEVGPWLLLQILYVEPVVDHMHRGTAGEWVATAQDIAERYGGDMKNHIHVAVILKKMTAMIKGGNTWNASDIYINPKIFFPDIEDDHGKEYR